MLVVTEFLLSSMQSGLNSFNLPTISNAFFIDLILGVHILRVSSKVFFKARGPISALVMSICLSICALPTAHAHHSTAMFDHSKSVTITGVVKEVQWTNPHVAIFINGGEGSEEPALWLMEMTSPGNLVRDGWSRTSVKAGDKVTVSFSPLRDTSKGKGGALKKLVLIDTGKVLTANIRAAERPNLEETPEK